jgi:hypothetical protein
MKAFLVELIRSYPNPVDQHNSVWYLSDLNWPEPNLVLLCNALPQIH